MKYCTLLIKRNVGFSALLLQTIWCLGTCIIRQNLVCVKEQRIVSDGDLQPSGYIDHLFCHYCYQEQAISSVLMTHAHICAEKTKYHSIFWADFSVIAKSFLKVNGIKELNHQAVLFQRQLLTHFKVIKRWVVKVHWIRNIK